MFSVMILYQDLNGSKLFIQLFLKRFTETPPINRYVAMVCLYFETGSYKAGKNLFALRILAYAFDGRRCDNIDKDRTKHVDGNNITSSQSRTASGFVVQIISDKQFLFVHLGI